MPDFFQSAISTLRTIGLTNATIYWLDRSLGKLTAGKLRVIKYYFLVQPLSSEIFSTRGGSYSFSLATPSDYSTIEFPRPSHIIDERVRNGYQCIIARKNDKLVAFLWYNARFYLEDEVRCKYLLGCPDNSVWDFDVYIDPKYRLGRLFSQLWAFTSEHLQNNGIDWSFSRVHAYNHSSLGAHSKLGAETIGWASFLVVGPLQLSISTHKPRIQLGLRTHSPTFTLFPPGEVG